MLQGADVVGSLCIERMTSPPFGLLEGRAGAAAVVTLTTPDGKSRKLPCKGAFQAPAGSVIDMITPGSGGRSEEHTSELQSLRHLVCRLLLEKKNRKKRTSHKYQYDSQA